MTTAKENVVKNGSRWFSWALLGAICTIAIGCGTKTEETEKDTTVAAELEVLRADIEALRTDVDDLAVGRRIQASTIGGMLNTFRDLRDQDDALRWDLDDVRILATAEEDSGEHPENTVVVSKGYPEIGRLPFGVKVDDQRPPEERYRVIYMAIDLGNGMEKRVYPSQVTWTPRESDAPPLEDTPPPAAE